MTRWLPCQRWGFVRNGIAGLGSFLLTLLVNEVLPGRARLAILVR